MLHVDRADDGAEGHSSQGLLHHQPGRVDGILSALHRGHPSSTGGGAVPEGRGRWILGKEGRRKTEDGRRKTEEGRRKKNKKGCVRERNID